MLSDAGTSRRLSVNQVRLLLGVIAFAIVGVGILITLNHHKLIVSDFPDPKNGADCNADYCDVVASGFGIGQNTGNTVGPIPYSQLYNGTSGSGFGKIRVSNAGAQTYANRCTVGSAANGYDGNYFGIRGQASGGADDPTWWYEPPTNDNFPGGRTVAAACRNSWNGGNGETYHTPNNGYQSINEDPANFINPGVAAPTINTADLPSGLPGGWADNSTANNDNYISSHPGQTWKNPVGLGAAGNDFSSDAGNFGTQTITCGGCGTPAASLAGSTFIYRVKFQLNPNILANYNLDSAVLRTYGGTWAKGWIDSLGKATDAGGTDTTPCRYDGVCVQADTTTGYHLESGFAGGGDYTSYFRNNPGGDHVLSIQVTVKNYSGSFAQQPKLAFHLVFQWSKKPPAPSVSFTKSVDSFSSGVTQGSVPVLRVGTDDTISFTNSATFTRNSADTVPHTITYTISDTSLGTDPPCIALSGGSHTTSGSFTITGTNPSKTVSFSPLFQVSASCPGGDNQYYNTAKITYTDSAGDGGTLTDQRPYYIQTPYYPWIQTQFGDVHSNGNIVTNKGSLATYVISAGGNISGFNSQSCLVLYSSSCSNAIGSYGTLAWPWMENPNFFTDVAANSVTSTIPSGNDVKTVIGPTIGNGTTSEFYVVTGGCTLNIGNVTVRGAVTIYVPCPAATVNITGDIDASNSSGTAKGIPALGIIAGSQPIVGGACNGDVNIANSVQNITDVIVFSTGVIHDGAVGTHTSNPLTVRGGLIGCQFDLRERIGTPPASGTTPANPAETLNYVGNFILNPPPGFLNLGQSGSTLQYSNESIPRL